MDINRFILHYSFYAVVIILFSTSCTVEKRLHTKGYNVHWKKNYSKSKLKSLKSTAENSTNGKLKAQTDDDFVATTKSFEINKSSRSIDAASNLLVAALPSSQIKTEGKQMLSLSADEQTTRQIIHLTSEHLKRFGDKPLKTKYFGNIASSIFHSKLENSNGPSPLPVEGSQIIALVLAIFLGMFGVHRFYLGDSGRGTMMLIGTLIGIVLQWLGGILGLIGWILLLVVFVVVILDIIKIILGQL